MYFTAFKNPCIMHGDSRVMRCYVGGLCGHVLFFVISNFRNHYFILRFYCYRIRGSARMSIPKMSTPIMSIRKMYIPIMSTVPKCRVCKKNIELFLHVLSVFGQSRLCQRKFELCHEKTRLYSSRLVTDLKVSDLESRGVALFM